MQETAAFNPNRHNLINAVLYGVSPINVHLFYATNPLRRLDPYVSMIKQGMEGLFHMNNTIAVEINELETL